MIVADLLVALAFVLGLLGYLVWVLCAPSGRDLRAMEDFRRRRAVMAQTPRATIVARPLAEESRDA